VPHNSHKYLSNTLIWILVFYTSNLGAQAIADYSFFSQKGSNNYLKVYENIELGSTTLSSSLVKKYLNNGSVGDEDRKAIEKHKDAINRLGFENNYGLSLIVKPDSILKRRNKIQYNLVVEQKNVASAVFTNDILKLILNGNSAFVGDTNGINIYPTMLDNYKFQKYGFGVGFDFSADSFSTHFYMRASYINAQKIATLLTHASNIKFADSTYAMSGNIDFLYQKTQGNNSYFANTGNGTAIDLGFEYAVNNATFTVLANDIGFVKWDKVKQVKVDTSFTFKGYNIDMQRLLHDSLYKITRDSVFNISKHESEKKLVTSLPYTLKLNSQLKWHDGKLISIIDFTFKNLVGFNPRILLSQYYNINSKFTTGVFVANGGFAKFQYGLLLNGNLKNLYLKLLVLNPHSYFINKALPVGGVNFSIGYSW